MAQFWPKGFGIYAIVNIRNGRKYYGKGKFAVRLSTHRTQLRKGTHPNQDLQSDWWEYGEGAFVFQAVEYLSPDDWAEGREAEYILAEPNCYNRDATGYLARQNGSYPIEHPSRNNGKKAK